MDPVAVGCLAVSWCFHLTQAGSEGRGRVR
jgi:hypothetical protein